MNDANRDDQNKEKKSLMADLLKLAKHDGEIKDIEFQFLLTLTSQIGLTKDDFKNIFEQYIAFLPPKMEGDRIVQFHRLVLLMNIDQEATTEELNYIIDMGIRMGLNPLATNQVLKIMYNYPNRLVPKEKLIEIFGLFHN